MHMAGFEIYLAYIVAGFGLVALLDTVLDVQNGPELHFAFAFALALCWPAVLFTIGMYVIWHGIRHPRL
jgi:hypothetical protein